MTNKLLKEQLDKLEKLEKVADVAEKEYQNDCTNEEKEKAFKAAYEEEFALYISLANAIVEYTNCEINFDTAKKMIKTKRSELNKILSGDGV